MDGVLLALRLILAVVFVVAAVTKLFDRGAARDSFERFGVPAGAVSAAVVAIPVAELAVAVALVPEASAVVAAVAGLALLAVFTVAAGRLIARGEEADCACFGRIASRPVGPGTIARNAVLMVMGAAVVAGGAGTSATGWIADLSALDAVLVSGVVVLALAVVLNAAFLLQLFRQNGRLWAELDALGAGGGQAGGPGIGIGEPAPSFVAADPEGESVDLGDMLDGLPTDATRLLLVFVSADCSACDPLLPEIGRQQRAGEGDTRVALIAHGSHDDVAAKCSEHGIDSALVIDALDAPRPFGINGFPGAVVVDIDGRVASEAAVGRQAVEELLGSGPGPGVPSLVHVGGGD